MIILNEREWAESAVRDITLGKNKIETLKLVALLYLDSGKSRQEAREMLGEFVLSCDPYASLVKMSSHMDIAMNYAIKHDFFSMDAINISADEMSVIRSIKVGKQAERLAFTLLCLAKYWNAKLGSDSGWVNTKDTEIMSLANIRTSIKRQDRIYKQLKDLGLITLSKKVDCTNVKVNFCTDSEDVVMSVTDCRNLGNQYLMYIGEPYFVCAECGAVTKANNAGVGRRQKYCHDCAAVVKARKSVESAIRKKNSIT